MFHDPVGCSFLLIVLRSYISSLAMLPAGTRVGLRRTSVHSAPLLPGAGSTALGCCVYSLLIMSGQVSAAVCQMDTGSHGRNMSWGGGVFCVHHIAFLLGFPGVVGRKAEEVLA